MVPMIILLTNSGLKEKRGIGKYKDDIKNAGSHIDTSEDQLVLRRSLHGLAH